VGKSEGAVPSWIIEDRMKRFQIAVTTVEVNMLRRVRENSETTRRSWCVII
jgi:hypothetical protein